MCELICPTCKRPSYTAATRASFPCPYCGVRFEVQTMTDVRSCSHCGARMFRVYFDSAGEKKSAWRCMECKELYIDKNGALEGI